jgi:hypothetical protein
MFERVSGDEIEAEIVIGLVTLMSKMHLSEQCRR